MEFIDLKSQQALIREELDKRIAAVLDHGRYVMGPEVFELEERLADYVGVKHCIGASSGTDTLLIALMALGVGPGDEVITVPYTWISTAEMIALLGAKPVFVDIDPQTFNMDPAFVEAAITERTKAIMPVCIYGQCADMDPINAIAEKHNLPVIEDAAQSFGATYKNRKSCALSSVGSTSFFPSKPLGAYGEGGAVFTKDADLARTMRQIRVHGQAAKHQHPILGLNGRFDAIQAAVVLAKLDVFDNEIAKRQTVADHYRDSLSGNSINSNNSRLILPSVSGGSTSVYAQYTILSPGRDALQARLKEAGIPSVSYYAVPLHLQPVFAYLGHKNGDFPVAEHVAGQGLSLPMNPYLKPREIERICNAILATERVSTGPKRSASGRR